MEGGYSRLFIPRFMTLTEAIVCAVLASLSVPMRTWQKKTHMRSGAEQNTLVNDHWDEAGAGGRMMEGAKKGGQILEQCFPSKRLILYVHMYIHTTYIYSVNIPFAHQLPPVTELPPNLPSHKSFSAQTPRCPRQQKRPGSQLLPRFAHVTIT